MSGLDSTVTGALVAGGFAVVGFSASALTTTSTLRANRNAARDQRLWEKREPLYEQLVGAAMSVQDSANAGRASSARKSSDLLLPPGLLSKNAVYDPSAVQVLRDRGPQVYAYASRDVSHAHDMLLQSLVPVPAVDSKVAEAAQSLMDQVRGEFQPSEIQRESLYWRIRRIRGQYRNRRFRRQIDREEATRARIAGNPRK